MFPKTVIRWSSCAISVILSLIIDGKTSVFNFFEAEDEIFPDIILDCIIAEPFVSLDFSSRGHTVRCLEIFSKTIHSSQLGHGQ